MAAIIRDWVRVAILPEYVACTLQTQSISHKKLVRKIDLFVDSRIRAEPILHRDSDEPPWGQPEKTL